ncbi:MAG: class I SAM-dependent methyltransferase [Candidatus Methylomirabilaceae bacterium]
MRIGVKAQGKFETVREVLHAAGASPGASLLDVGCRECELRSYLPHGVHYVGLDLFQNAEGTVDHVLSVEQCLPFPDQNFDFVVALDLVEHLDDLSGGLKELARVTRRQLMVLLPNMAFVTFRLGFLLHGRFVGTDKYDLTYRMGPDRHRWLTVLPQTDDYMRDFARDNGLLLERTICQEGPKKELVAKFARAVRLPESWWAWKVLYSLSRP